ncbi:unnamed protein product [Meganyctiphanes norvegica]|uniref:Secreted frizzled-related protein 3 n=1 Tax=Meganyctiphanes norvegica TaxID=48144 RepID=A0AAV2PY03_MEGNR
MALDLFDPSVSGHTAAVWVVWVCVWGPFGVDGVGGMSNFAPQCELVSIPMCQHMPYNLTRMPNLLHHSSQENAKLAIDQFELLRWTKCSDQLEFFLCSMYAPICTVNFVTEAAIPPCRRVCEAARYGCEPLLNRFDIAWPSNLDCSQLPLYDRGVCITPEAIITSDSAPGKVEDDGKCQCQRTPKLREKLYKNRKYDFVFRAVVQSVETFGRLTLSIVHIKEIVKPGRVMVPEGLNAHLFTNRSCACPPLQNDKEYLLMGWEDFVNSRLLYLEGSLAVPYRKKFARKVKVWEGSSIKTGTKERSVNAAEGPEIQMHINDIRGQNDIHFSNTGYPGLAYHSSPQIYNQPSNHKTSSSESRKPKRKRRKNKRKKKNRRRRKSEAKLQMQGKGKTKK